MKPWVRILIVAASAVLVGLCVFLIIFFSKGNDPKMIENVTIEKSASPSVSQNVAAGGEIEYKITVSNGNEKRCKLSISDTLPANAVYLEGDAKADGAELSFSLSLKDSYFSESSKAYFMKSLAS